MVEITGFEKPFALSIFRSKSMRSSLDFPPVDGRPDPEPGGLLVLEEPTGLRSIDPSGEKNQALLDQKGAIRII